MPEGSEGEALRYQVCHNVFIAHAKATKALQDLVPDAKMGGMVTYLTTYPATCKPEDALANQQVKELLMIFILMYLQKVSIQHLLHIN